MTDSEKTDLQRIAGLVADGATVDWASLEGSGELSADELKALRLLQEVAQVHRPRPGAPSTHGETEEVPRGFEVKGELGSGATGHVWRAFDRALSREVALKVVKPDAAASALARARFLEEARVLASLRHPNIVQVFSIAEEGGAIRIVLELVEGRTLAELVKNEGPLDAHEAARVGIELCRALSALHARGIVHRDLKPSNVMRERGGRIVLLDFGLARSAASRRQLSSASAGTPRFMAPEQFEAGETTPAADLWSLGALLYWLLSEQYAFEGRDYAELERNVASGNPRPLVDRCPAVPADFAHVVARALEREPARRFASAGEMEAALRACLDAAPRAQSPPRRGWGWPLAGLVALLVAIVVWQAWPEPRLEVTGLELFARRGNQDVRLASGGTTFVGDHLVLELAAEQECYVYVLDEDELGNVSVLFPVPGFSLQNPLARGETHRLPGAWEGEPQSWVVTSAGGGGENILVVACREPLEPMEHLLRSLPTVTPGAEPEYPGVPPEQQRLLLRGIGGTQAEPTTVPGAKSTRSRLLDTVLAGLDRDARATRLVRSFRLQHAP